MAHSEYNLVSGKVHLTNTHFYEENRIKNTILQKVIPIFFVLYGATKTYEVISKYIDSQKSILILFLLLFLGIFSIGVYIFYDAFFKLSWRTKHLINDTVEVILDQDGNETDLKIKLNSGKKVLLSFRTLEKEHERFLNDINAKKASNLKITENERV